MWPGEGALPPSRKRDSPEVFFAKRKGSFGRIVRCPLVSRGGASVRRPASSRSTPSRRRCAAYGAERHERRPVAKTGSESRKKARNGNSR